MISLLFLTWFQSLPTEQPTMFICLLLLPQLFFYFLLMKRVEYFYGLYTSWIPLMYYFFLIWLTVLQSQGRPILENQLPIGLLGAVISTALIVLGVFMRGKSLYNTIVPIKLLQLFPWSMAVTGVVWALLIIYRFEI